MGWIRAEVFHLAGCQAPAMLHPDDGQPIPIRVRDRLMEELLRCGGLIDSKHSPCPLLTI